MFDEIRKDACAAICELLSVSGIRPGEILVVGCSTSEIIGRQIGQQSCPDAAGAILEGIIDPLTNGGILLAAQCCEHLNRALVVESKTAEKFGLEAVCARPVSGAGGSFAAAVFDIMDEPVLVEQIRASAGIDIGGTLIGMHLKAVAVPVRLSVRVIGFAPVLAARTRPKLIGGIRAQYPD